MEKKRKKGRKFLRAVGIILASLLVLSGGYLLFLHFSTQDYYAHAEKVFPYPELNAGFIPQGISYDADSDSFFITGYKTLFRPSPVYVIDRKTGEQKAFASLQKEDGSKFAEHAGGIGVFGDYVYINDGYEGTYVYSRSQILSAENGGSVRALGRFFANVDSETIKSSFCDIHDGLLTIGEFYFPLFLATPKSHHFETPSGGRTKALAVSYPLDAECPFGVDLENPAAVYALPEEAQGICFTNDSIFVSFSFGPALSKIAQYDRSSLMPFGTFEGVPLYVADGSSLLGEYRIPPHSEELEVVDQYLYIVSESAADPYFFGKLTGGDWCWRTPLPLP